MSITLKVSSSAVAKTIKRYDETGSHEDRHRKGRPRVTSAAEDKLIRVNSLRNCSPKKCFIEFHLWNFIFMISSLLFYNVEIVKIKTNPGMSRCVLTFDRYCI
jgi:hypothetical protein